MNQEYTAAVAKAIERCGQITFDVGTPVPNIGLLPDGRLRLWVYERCGVSHQYDTEPDAEFMALATPMLLHMAGNDDGAYHAAEVALTREAFAMFHPECLLDR